MQIYFEVQGFVRKFLFGKRESYGEVETFLGESPIPKVEVLAARQNFPPLQDPQNPIPFRTIQYGWHEQNCWPF